MDSDSKQHSDEDFETESLTLLQLHGDALNLISKFQHCYQQQSQRIREKNQMIARLQDILQHQTQQLEEKEKRIEELIMKRETCEEGRAANTQHSKELEELRERLEAMKEHYEKQKEEREAIAMELEETKRALTQEQNEKEDMRKRQEELIEEHTRKTSEYEEETKRLEEENRVLKEKRELEDDQECDVESEEEEENAEMKNGAHYEINQDMVNAPTEESKNVFGIARKNGDTQQITSMIEEEHLDVNGKEDTQRTLLHICAQTGNVELCKWLIEHGADVNSENKIGTTPALVASQNGHVEVLKVLVEFHADLNKSNNDGWCPIHSASARGHVDVVKYLISQGVELNVCEKQRHHSPLMMCILSRKFKMEIMEALLGAGADWTLRSKIGNTCLHACAENDNVEAARVLVDYPNLRPPMDLNIRSTVGRTALQLCTCKCAPKMGDFLSERLGIRHKPTIISSGRRSLQTNSLPDSTPAPAPKE